MKKVISVIMILSLLLVLCSCSRYINSYSALGLVKNQTSDSCSASFLSLKGRLAFRLNDSFEGSNGNIKYNVQVDKGELYIYYDSCGTKEELAHVKAGETAQGLGYYTDEGKPVYIIIEATETAKGKVSCELVLYSP